MKWEELVDQLKEVQKILVVGPPHSGTRITAVVLGKELGYQYVAEERWMSETTTPRTNRNYADFMKRTLPQQPERNQSIHSPVLFRYVHEPGLGGNSPNTAVVVLIRNIHAIVASQKRRDVFDWVQKDWSKDYEIGLMDGELMPSVQYNFWQKIQKERVTNPFELDYNSLRTHPSWVTVKDRRLAFKDGKWKPGSYKL